MEKFWLLLALPVLLCALPAYSRVLTVGPNEDLYDLGLAFEIAMNGDQIIILDGLLSPSVTIPTYLRDIVIESDPDSPRATVGGVSWTEGSRNFTFRRIKFDASSNTYKTSSFFSALRTMSVSDLTFEDCSFSGLGSPGSFFETGYLNRTLTITKSTCASSSGGFIASTYYSSTAKITVLDSVFESSGCLSWQTASGSPSFLLSNCSFSCTSSSSSYASYCDSSYMRLKATSSRLIGNTFQSTVGIYIDSPDTQILNNTFNIQPKFDITATTAYRCVIRYNSISNEAASRWDNLFTASGAGAQLVDARFNYFGSLRGPAALQVSALVRPSAYFPWCLTEDCSSLAQDCMQACPTGACSYDTGHCSPGLKGEQLFPIIFCTTFGILFLSVFVFRRKILARNRGVYAALRLRLGEARPLLANENPAVDPPQVDVPVEPLPADIVAALPEPESEDESEADPESHNMWVVCLSEKRKFLCVPCGHLCLCNDCAQLLENSKKCPLCRQAIHHLQRVYK
eukprot:TRINITY_DN8147_c0_g1_i1.p1 TRINITY_DN8147_c0_g1~~TRINITY_DN8147_c0_g1_i1.p1  ORF type:complete len:513 (+),score=63.92 TRINITY_DN8147_c0_g1_i1:74-1612(+)